MRTLLTLLALAALALPGASCGDSEPDSRLPPSKQDAIDLLLALDEAIQAQDLARAVDCMVLFPGMTVEKAQRDLPVLLAREGLSKAAVERFAAKARFGPLEEIFPKRGRGWAEKAGVDPAYCVALSAEPAEVGIYWGGEGLKVFRFDDLGKLK